ncbi:RlpA-like double-psi beta-barrel-protein domain-containing protein-containing protein [Podospora fimiseda]|uniref:RlpA-like double-psi beta-barrel-protein domain-containing protein-containing protein n=1 Tax=Podospora fimiseda TaxID=252190 RepID=A0AAN7BG96_9PEZI|nr:RlpA-like double-psi beta-barrel-protein domain-containing protein-containing protein [Podospora fimiseda]
MFSPKSLIILSLALLSSAAPASTEAQSVEARSGEIVARATGDLTWYNTGLGACGFWNNDNELVAALNAPTFDPKTPGGNPNKNTLCNKKIRVTYQGKSVDVKVVDRCPGCNANALDLSPAAFKKLASLDKGRIVGTWNWI